MLILVPKITNRLYYIFELMLKDELGIDFKFTTDKDSYSLIFLALNLLNFYIFLFVYGFQNILNSSLLSMWISYRVS